ncbi:class I adenylate-forming enzyme family protein [Algirhabdus cladophorae]|uniref:class I adenylate-forming enzyme family protein n=1 Tax=Algirhabdus cladophorae TaxID=3377108 RepID=UPI003B849497
MTSVFDQGPPAPCPARFNMAAYVLHAGAKTPEKCALEVLHSTHIERWSYGQIRQAVLGLANGLQHNAGLGAGDIVLMRLGNEVAFPIAYLACIAAGVVPVPASAQLTPVELDKIVADLSPKAMLSSHGVSLPTRPDLPCYDVAWQSAQYSGPQASPIMGDPNRLAYIVYTSGTSGAARAVGHAHRAVWARRMMWDGWYGLERGDRLLHAGALNWTYTLGTGIIDPWSIGATALVCADGTDHARLPDLIEAHDITLFAAAPAVYRRLLRQPRKWSAPHLRHGLSAGEKMAPSISHDWQTATQTPVIEAYGMTECSTFVSANPKAPSQLCPQPGRHVAIVDDAGTPLPYGQPGTIAVHKHDQGFMLGYLNAVNEAEDRIKRDWFLTGDQGVMEASGTLTYLGRDDDMMNAGGVRVSPIEVEAAMMACADIGDCAAATVRIKADTDVIALFYTGAADEPALRSHAQTYLADYKRPRLYIAIDVLPKGPNNKVLRKELRASVKGPQNGEA